VIEFALVLDLPKGDENPGPVERDLNPLKFEKREGSLLGVGDGHYLERMKDE
jgi:hypothetical protein